MYVDSPGESIVCGEHQSTSKEFPALDNPTAFLVSGGLLSMTSVGDLLLCCLFSSKIFT